LQCADFCASSATAQLETVDEAVRNAVEADRGREFVKPRGAEKLRADPEAAAALARGIDEGAARAR
jgi:hypothetical protein